MSAGAAVVGGHRDGVGGGYHAGVGARGGAFNAFQPPPDGRCWRKTSQTRRFDYISRRNRHYYKIPAEFGNLLLTHSLTINKRTRVVKGPSPGFVEVHAADASNAIDIYMEQ